MLVRLVRWFDELACCKHRIKKKNPSICDVARELFIEQFWLAGFLVPLYKDFTNSHRTTTISQTLLHCLSCSHDGNTTYFPFEPHSEIDATYRCRDRLFNHWQVIEPLLYEEAYDPVRVEDEIGTASPSISDHATNGVSI